MKKFMGRGFIILSILVLAMFFWSGCDNSNAYDEQPSVAVALVLGNHANSYGLNLNNPDLIAAVSGAASKGFVSVICCDGQPYLVSADIYTVPPQYRQAAPAKLEADAKAKAGNILAGLTEVKAKSPELDTLAALTQAVRSFASAPTDSEKIIYVVDSGLSTAGQLDFRINLLDTDPAVIADLLAERGALPDFTDITVKWLQLGDVATLQKPLSYANAQKLSAIWTAIIEKGGGKVEISGAPPNPTANDASQFPPISTVDVPTEKPILFDPAKTTVFSEQQLRFIADSAEYVDPATVKAILQPVADYMVQHPEFKGLLIGTTASGNRESCIRLSQNRAAAVRDTLVSMGVDSERLVLCGLGFENPWHVADTDSNGQLIENLASQNRRVVLMAADSPEALAILNEKQV